MSSYHTPVLLQEILEFLNVKKGDKYIDATLGGGGHALEILKRGGKVLGIDVDSEAIEYVTEEIKTQNLKYIASGQLTLAKGNFKDIAEIAKKHEFDKVAGILFDLGVSSHQLESQDRGFSFQKDGPLDMRMDKNLSVKALDLINFFGKGELYDLFYKLGEERYARTVSQAIYSARKIKPITTTMELASIIEKAIPGHSEINKATRIFQALRIAVNDELRSIEEAMPKALSLFSKDGVLAVISFHSLEDRIIKQTFKKFYQEEKGEILTKKPIVPNFSEIEKNSRARSAKLRVFKAK